MRFKALVFLAMIFDLEEIRYTIVFNLDAISIACCFYSTGYNNFMKAVARANAIKYIRKDNETMRVDDEIYNPDHLKENDKSSLNAIESVKVRVLSPDVIESFLEDKGITGIQAQLYSEFLKEFIAFQNELAEYEKVDFIIGAIDSYSEAEFDMLHKQAQEKSALKADKLLQST